MITQREMNFVDPAVSLADRALFMGPLSLEDGPFIDIQPGWTMAHVMHAADVFPSVKQAKKNGWDKPLPIGYNELVVGKSKRRIYILTKFD